VFDWFVQERDKNLGGNSIFRSAERIATRDCPRFLRALRQLDLPQCGAHRHGEAAPQTQVEGPHRLR
jgi:hypothetical protein